MNSTYAGRKDIMPESKLAYIFANKAARVFVFGLVSVFTPIYLDLLGFSPFDVGIAITAIIAGNVISNIVLTWYGDRVGRKRILLIFSFLMFLSGILLFFTTFYPLILIGLLIGNISTTGTEAGPFQSVETGILPMLVDTNRRSRVFGEYNLVGYASSSVGALAASLPAHFSNDISIFHLLYLVYGLVGLLLVFNYRRLGKEVEVATNKGRRGLELGAKAKKDIKKLSAFYSIDAFGGGFVSQSILAYWFYLVYHVSLGNLGLIFFIANVITALSTFGASLIAERLGNLRTMVYTHLLSNVFLIFIALAGSFFLSITFLFLRQTMSQMDVPTRQAFMAEIFADKDRVSANAITNTFRSVSNGVGPSISGLVLAIGLASVPILAGGLSKIAYDLAIFASYRKEVK